ncbi:hypothetical protein GGI21_003933 [Coemansia aciculifera]|nr:hypothetical protein GGI21_003933 [Coemansia aciculifera]
MQWVLRTAPLARKICVTIDFCQISLSRVDHQGLTDLVYWVYQMSDLVRNPDSKPGGFQEPITHGIYHLVDLSFHGSSRKSRFMILTRQNALTLQSLDIDVHTVRDVTGLVQDDSGDFVQYPRLLTLQLKSHLITDSTLQLLKFDGAVPFPNLQHLQILGTHPFDDDTLFRSNASVLESLTIPMNIATAKILRRHDVFTATSHPRLKNVNIKLTCQLIPWYFANLADCTRFILSIGSAAPVRTIGNYLDGVLRTTFDLAAIGEFKWIRVLSLPKLYGQFWDFVALIKSLPSLSSLDTGTPFLHDFPLGESLATLPAYVISTYALLSERFRCWRFNCTWNTDYDQAARCVLLLALVCPNFDYVSSLGKNMRRFEGTLIQLISADEYKSYASRLSRLRLQ